MKKIVVGGLLAIGLLALSDQQASAWVNSKFGIGFNWAHQSGANNFLWGAYKNGQVPGPEAYGFPGGNMGPMGASGFQGYGMAPQGYGSYAYAPQSGFQGYAPQGNMPTPQGSSPQGSFERQTTEPPFAGHYTAPYVFANYAQPVYYYYASPYYYYGGR